LSSDFGSAGSVFGGVLAIAFRVVLAALNLNLRSALRCASNCCAGHAERHGPRAQSIVIGPIIVEPSGSRITEAPSPRGLSRPYGGSTLRGCVLLGGAPGRLAALGRAVLLVRPGRRDFLAHEIGLELATGAADPAFHRADAAAHDFGDLLMAELGQG